MVARCIMVCNKPLINMIKHMHNLYHYDAHIIRLSLEYRNTVVLAPTVYTILIVQIYTHANINSFKSLLPVFEKLGMI